MLPVCLSDVFIACCFIFFCQSFFFFLFAVCIFALCLGCLSSLVSLPLDPSRSILFPVLCLLVSLVPCAFSFALFFSFILFVCCHLPLGSCHSVLFSILCFLLLTSCFVCPAHLNLLPLSLTRTLYPFLVPFSHQYLEYLG